MVFELFIRFVYFILGFILHSMLSVMRGDD